MSLVVERYPYAAFLAIIEGAGVKEEKKKSPNSVAEANGRNNYLTSIAGTMHHRGVSDEALPAAVAAINAGLEPPLPDDEVAGIIKHILRYEPRQQAPVFKATDAGNAERFVFHNQDMRYCTDKGEWLAWDGVRWAEDTGGSVAAHRALLTVRKIDADVADCEKAEIRAAMREWAHKSESAERLGAMIRVARSLPGAKCRVTAFDRDPWLLNVENGILDLRRGELRPHDHSVMCSKLAPVRYVPGARSEVLEKYLRQATGGDEGFIAFLQRALGYTLTGDTGAESIFLVLGPGGSGKTTLVEAFKDMLGDYALTAAAKTLLERKGDSGHTSDVARMHGRRMICTSEIAKGKTLDSALLKSLTGGERVVARNIWEADAEFTPMGKFWLAANDAPGVADDDTGMWRRIIRVPFTRVIPEAERDVKVKATLRTDPDARSALLAWALQGCLEWQTRAMGRQGLSVPAVVSKATSAYREEQNPLRDFLDEMCEAGEERWVEVSSLRKAYAEFCRSSGMKPQPPHAFNSRLEADGHQRKPKRVGNKVAKVWVGLSLVSDAQNEPKETPF